MTRNSVFRLGNALSLAVLLGAGGCHRETKGDSSPAAESKQGASGGGKASGDKGASGGNDKGAPGGNTAEGNEGSVTTDTVRIPPADQARAGIQIAAVIVRSVPRTLTTAGQVFMDERHTDHIGALADGRIESVYVLPGDIVRRSQTLANLHSHTVHETVMALTQAFADVTRQQSAVRYATQARDRYNKLFGIQAASLEERQRSEQDLAQANKDLTGAEATVIAEREHLAELLQVNPEVLQPGTLYQRELIPVRAVAAGTVITRSITPGQVVNTGDETFVISNLGTVWVNASVNEKDVPDMHIGAAASVTTQGQGANGFRGTVTMLGDMVDPQTRALPVRISVANPGTRLRPGMFVTAAISEPASRNAIFVPQNALQDINGFRVVFVTSDGTAFQARAVKTGAQVNNLVEIVEGLEPTDHVVANGAFMVKGELLKGTVGEG